MAHRGRMTNGTRPLTNGGRHRTEDSNDGRPLTKVLETFRQWDVSGTECISKKKLTKLFQELNPDFSEQRINKMLRSLDLDDSETDLINYVTFVTAIENFSLQEKTQRALEENLLQHFRTLSYDHQARATNYVETLHKLQDCESFFDSELTPVDQEVLRRLFVLCAQVGGDPESLTFSEFERVHEAISQLLGDLGQASWGISGHVFSADPEEEWSKASMDISSTLSKAEMTKWMHDIYDSRAQAIPGSMAEFMTFVQEVELRCRGINESDKFLKAMDLQQGLAQYGEAYRKLKNHPDFECIHSEMPDDPDSLMQPANRDGSATVFDDLIAQAKQISRKVETIGQELRNVIGAPFWSMGPLKGRPRSEEKVRTDYEGEFRRLADVLRFSVVCDNLHMVRDAIDHLKERSDIVVRRIKSGFEPTANVAQCGGYRDLKLNCEHKDNGHIFEIQLHVLIFYSLKQQGGHEVYTWARQFSVKGILTATDVLEDLSPELLLEMSLVARRRVSEVEQDQGVCSTLAMQWKMALVQIARITKNREDLAVVKGLLELAETKAFKAAGKYDIAEIQLLACRSTVLPEDKGIELATAARSVVDNIPKEDLTTSDILLAARCNQAIGVCYLSRGKKRKKKGDVSNGMQDLERAQQQLRLALEQFEDELPEAHPTLLSIKENLGGCLSSLDRQEEAVALLLQIATAVQKNLGEDHLQTAKSCSKLGLAYQQLKKYRQALAFLEYSLACRVRNVGSAHPSVAKEYCNLAECRLKAGDLRGALHDFRIAEILQTQESGEKTNSDLLATREKVEMIDKQIMQEKTEVSMLISSLNFLGAAYNATEFMCNDRYFQENYPKVRDGLSSVTSNEVVENAVAIGFDLSLRRLLPESQFEKNCSEEFLKLDNKLDLRNRTNMVVAGMMPLEDGQPLCEHLAQWRELMKKQKDHYKQSSEILLWDTACNLAMEKQECHYRALCNMSYLNPSMLEVNMDKLLHKAGATSGDGQPALLHSASSTSMLNNQTVDDALMRPGSNSSRNSAQMSQMSDRAVFSAHYESNCRTIICAVQEFPPEGTPKNKVLLEQLKARGLKHVTAEGVSNSSVGFILSSDLEVEKLTYAPLGSNPDKAYSALGLPDRETVDKRDLASLKTTAFKTLVLDLAAASDRPALRVVNVHAKEFKSDRGVGILAKYLQLLARYENTDGRSAVVLLDANTATPDKSSLFAERLVELGFDVLSPPTGGYKTTRKQRSEMHGQIYDENKCNVVREAQKTFAALMTQSPGDVPVWQVRSNARCFPDLRYAKCNLPNSRWPSDHCMMQVELHCTLQGPDA